jgi:cytochrome c oxidase subunit 1
MEDQINKLVRFYEGIRYKYSVFFNYLDKNFEKFFFSTNHKDIGTLYLLFSLIAGIIGTLFSFLYVLSLVYRVNISLWEIINYICCNNSTCFYYDFFMVMPALIGGFGNWFVPL